MPSCNHPEKFQMLLPFDQICQVGMQLLRARLIYLKIYGSFVKPFLCINHLLALCKRKLQSLQLLVGILQLPTKLVIQTVQPLILAPPYRKPHTSLILNRSLPFKCTINDMTLRQITQQGHRKVYAVVVQTFSDAVQQLCSLHCGSVVTVVLLAGLSCTLQEEGAERPRREWFPLLKKGACSSLMTYNGGPFMFVYPSRVRALDSNFEVTCHFLRTSKWRQTLEVIVLTIEQPGVSETNASRSWISACLSNACANSELHSLSWGIPSINSNVLIHCCNGPTAGDRNLQTFPLRSLKCSCMSCQFKACCGWEIACFIAIVIARATWDASLQLVQTLLGYEPNSPWRQWHKKHHMNRI